MPAWASLDAMTSWVLSVLPALLHVSALAPPDEVAARARFAESDLDYDRAADLWLEVIGNPDTTDALRFEANLQAGAIERIRGNDTEARFHFQYVLRKDPDFRLPDETPPKVRNFFELVRQEVKAERARSAPGAPAPAAVAPASTARPPATAEPLSGGASPTVASGAPATDPPSVVDETGESAGLPLLPLTLVGVGAASAGFAISALGAGALVGSFAVDRYNQAVASNVQVERHDFYEAAQGAALIANVSFTAGAFASLAALTLVGAGGVLWLVE